MDETPSTKSQRPPSEVCMAHPEGECFEYRGRTFMRRGGEAHLVLPPVDQRGCGGYPDPLLPYANLRSRIEAIYERYPHHILPSIGYDFAPRKDGDFVGFRVLAVGINSYVSAGDWPPKPQWFRTWFEEGKLPFYRGARAEASVLARAVAGRSVFRDTRYREEWGIYGTNAVKCYLPEADGKRADQERLRAP